MHGGFCADEDQGCGQAWPPMGSVSVTLEHLLWGQKEGSIKEQPAWAAMPLTADRTTDVIS